MKAAVYKRFKGEILLTEVSSPKVKKGSVLIELRASGICRSDWWGWQGHDSDIVLPHIPGHELAGIVAESGANVKKWKPGDRVTVPFVGGCGSCSYCKNGQHQVCDNQFQPGFTAWGSFAEYVEIDYADENLVRLPEYMGFTEAASLGCRFVTAYRALLHQGRLRAGEFLAVFGCGGVGLSAIMIAKSIGAKVIAVDIEEEKLNFAKSLGADYAVNSLKKDPEEEIKDLSQGGAHVTLDALGLALILKQSLRSLRKQGRHVQVGLMEEEEANTEIPINLITGGELEVYGSHGMQASKYSELFKLIEKGDLKPEKLITQRVNLSEGIKILSKMDSNPPKGVAVISDFKS